MQGAQPLADMDLHLGVLRDDMEPKLIDRVGMGNLEDDGTRLRMSSRDWPSEHTSEGHIAKREPPCLFALEAIHEACQHARCPCAG
eukprot:11824688-Heterocapsa_arctica.AAC.1